MRPSRSISAVPERPIKIELKDVWKISGETGVYKIVLNEDDLGFNIIHMVRIICLFVKYDNSKVIFLEELIVVEFFFSFFARYNIIRTSDVFRAILFGVKPLLLL